MEILEDYAKIDCEIDKQYDMSFQYTLKAREEFNKNRQIFKDQKHGFLLNTQEVEMIKLADTQSVNRILLTNHDNNQTQQSLFTIDNYQSNQ